MYSIERHKLFEKDVKKCSKRNWDFEELETAVNYLHNTGTLPVITSKKYNPHKLKGNYVHHWEGHIKPDWLIIWLVNDDSNTVTLVRTGTHADLF
jgi:mRNA interferase YafQ